MKPLPIDAVDAEWQVKQDRVERKVLLALGKYRSVGAFDETAWALLTPDEAREMARLLRQYAYEVEKSSP